MKKEELKKAIENFNVACIGVIESFKQATKEMKRLENIYKEIKK